MGRRQPQYFRSLQGFPGGTVVKNSPANAGDTTDVGSIPGLGRFPWRRPWQPTPVFLPGKSHGWWSLVGSSPWGRPRLECVCTRTRTHTHTHTHTQRNHEFITLRKINNLVLMERDNVQLLCIIELKNTQISQHSQIYSQKSAVDFHGGPVVNNLPANAGDTDPIPGPGGFHIPRGN